MTEFERIKANIKIMKLAVKIGKPSISGAIGNYRDLKEEIKKP